MSNIKKLESASEKGKLINVPNLQALAASNRNSEDAKPSKDDLIERAKSHMMAAIAYLNAATDSE